MLNNSDKCNAQNHLPFPLCYRGISQCLPNFESPNTPDQMLRLADEYAENPPVSQYQIFQHQIPAC